MTALREIPTFVETKTFHYGTHLGNLFGDATAINLDVPHKPGALLNSITGHVYLTSNVVVNLGGLLDVDQLLKHGIID